MQQFYLSLDLILRNLGITLLISTPIFIIYKYYTYKKKNNNKWNSQSGKSEDETHTRGISWFLRIQLEIDRKRIHDANTIANDLQKIKIKLHFKDFSDPYMYILLYYKIVFTGMLMIHVHNGPVRK